MWSTRREHPTAAQLERFLRGEDAPALAREHLEAGCIPCVTRASERLRQASADRGAVRAWIRALYGDQNGQSRARVQREIARRTEAFARMVRYEEAVGPALLESLLGLKARPRRVAIRNRRPYQTLGLARFLTAAAREEVFRDVERAIELGELAVEVAELLAEAGYTPGQANDTRALAWGALANAHRVSSDLPVADRVLRQAGIIARDGSGDRMVEAELLSLEGSLRLSQARFEDARGVLEIAAGLYARHGDPDSEAKVLTQLGKALGDGGAPEEAVAVLERVDELLSGEERGRVHVYGLHCRAAYLNESGRTTEARGLLERLRPLWIRDAPGFANQQRLLWLDARISWSEGDLEAAEAKFAEVRDGWEEHEEPYELALVSLDLAALLLEQGRTSEVKNLAERMLPVFHSQDVHHHAMAALVLVQRAIEAERATVALLQNVARYLRSAQHNPALAFPGFK